jgi:hypothetical protein
VSSQNQGQSGNDVLKFYHAIKAAAAALSFTASTTPRYAAVAAMKKIFILTIQEFFRPATRSEDLVFIACNQNKSSHLKR